MATASVAFGQAVICDCLEAIGRVRMRLGGNCMRPVLDPGDVVIVASAARQRPRVGDVVLTRQGPALRLHRLVWRPWLSSGRWRTAADRGGWDPAIAAGDVLGSVVEVETSRGDRRPMRHLWWWAAARSSAREVLVWLGLGHWRGASRG